MIAVLERLLKKEEDVKSCPFTPLEPEIFTIFIKPRAQLVS